MGVVLLLGFRAFFHFLKRYVIEKNGKNAFFGSPFVITVAWGGGRHVFLHASCYAGNDKKTLKFHEFYRVFYACDLMNLSNFNNNILSCNAGSIQNMSEILMKKTLNNR